MTSWLVSSCSLAPGTVSFRAHVLNASHLPGSVADSAGTALFVVNNDRVLSSYYVPTMLNTIPAFLHLIHTIIYIANEEARLCNSLIYNI